jgi:CRISPR-associated protein (TIGR02584 family)
MSTVLIATLGAESQVVTLSLLELEQLGFAVDEVAVIHTAGQDPKIVKALTRLRQAFAQTEWLQRYRHRFEILQGRAGAIADITTETEAEDVFNEMFRVVRNYKLDDYQIHLNIAGGRKPMSIYGMVTTH